MWDVWGASARRG